MAPKRNLLQVNVKIQVATKSVERQLKCEKDRNNALQRAVGKLMLEKECLRNTLNLMAQEWKKALQENKQVRSNDMDRVYCLFCTTFRIDSYHTVSCLALKPWNCALCDFSTKLWPAWQEHLAGNPGHTMMAWPMYNYGTYAGTIAKHQRRVNAMSWKTHKDVVLEVLRKQVDMYPLQLCDESTKLACLICDAVFGNSGLLLTHIGRIHCHCKSFGCIRCRELFETRVEAESHYIQRHWPDTSLPPGARIEDAEKAFDNTDVAPFSCALSELILLHCRTAKKLEGTAAVLLHAEQCVKEFRFPSSLQFLAGKAIAEKVRATGRSVNDATCADLPLPPKVQSYVSKLNKFFSPDVIFSKR